MKVYICSLLIVCPILAFGQSLEERKAQLDPRNYENGMVLINDAEFCLRAADISHYTILDSTVLTVRYNYRQKSADGVQTRTPELMQLEIGRHWTKFYSYDAFQQDSSFTIRKNDGMNRSVVGDYMPYEIYYALGKKTWEVVTRLPFYSGSAVVYHDTSYPRWHVDTLTSIRCGYPCLKATTNYGGRKWLVWFTPEIPAPFGPWKLHGLPGLILWAEDADGLFIFECSHVSQSPIRELKKYAWHYTPRSKKAWLKYEKNMYQAPYTIFGKSTLVISSKNGVMNASWQAPYNPLELE